MGLIVKLMAPKLLKSGYETGDFPIYSLRTQDKGYSKLLTSGLGDTYLSTSTFIAIEYFDVDIDEHIRGLMENVNNEY